MANLIRRIGRTMNTSGEQNRSVRNTKRKLMEALMGLLQRKPLKQVTVKELTETADVNRGTFYFHYQDVYAMANELEDKFLSGLEATLDAIEHDQKNFMSILLAWLSDNAASCKILLGPNGDDKFQDKIKHIVDEKCAKLTREAFPTLEENELNMVGSFVMGGVISVLKALACGELKMDAPLIEQRLNSILFDGMGTAVASWHNN